MKKIELSYTEFNDVITDLTFDLGYMLPEYETVVKFYSSVENKFATYLITDYTSGLDYTTIKILESFGVTFSDRPIAVVNRLMIIDPSKQSSIEDLVHNYDDESRANMGDSVENYRPTHFIVLTSNSELVDYYYNELIKFYGSITRIQYKVDSLDTTAVLNTVLTNINRMGINGSITEDNLLDIQDYCNSVRNIKATTINGLSEINKIIEDIHSKADKKIICNLSPISYPDQTFAVLAVELNLRYGLRFYSHPTDLEAVCSIMMDCLFNVGHQLFEDAIAYFTHLPSALVSLESFGVLYHTIDQKTLETVIEVAYSEAKDISNSESHLDTFSIEDIQIEPFFNCYDLNSIAQCKALKESFMEMYASLDIHSDIIDVSRIIFFYKKSNGVIDRSTLYQGFINDFKFNVKTISTCVDSDPCTMELNYDKLRRCYPLTIFLDGQLEISKLLQHKVNWNMLVPYNKYEPMTAVISNRIMTRDCLADCKIPKYISWFKCGNSVEFRNGFYKRLIDFRGLDSTREFLDVFGFASSDLVDELYIGGYNGAK